MPPTQADSRANRRRGRRAWADAPNLWKDPTCSGPHLLPAEPALDLPGETSRVLKNREENQFGEYRTGRPVLEAWR